MDRNTKRAIVGVAVGVAVLLSCLVLGAPALVATALGAIGGWIGWEVSGS
jgi:hypothetical protein